MRALGVALVIAAMGGAVHAGPDAGTGTAQKSTDQKLVYTSETMGTNVQVTFWTSDDAAAAKAAQDVFDEFDRLDKLLSHWKDDSEVGQINANAGIKAVPVSDETLLIIQRSLAVSKASKGIFDITVGSFQGLWKFDQDMDGSLPDPAEVKKRLKLVNWKNVIVDAKKKTVKLKKKGMKITLGGIAKGYAVDRGVAILEKLGYQNFIVQAGGDMYVSGKKGDKPWMVGIRDPRGDRADTFAVAPIENHSFSTSGDYERGFVKDGIRYHHILDPRDGQPAHATRSVTVMAKDAFTADSWSKVLFILGADKAMSLVEKMDDFEAVWVTSKNEVVTSPGLEDKLVILKPPTDGT